MWMTLRRYPTVSVVVLTVMIITATVAPIAVPHDPIKQDLRARNAPPMWFQTWYEEHPKVTKTYVLGADFVGRDVLSRVMYGARISLLVATTAMFTTMVLGTIIGMLAGYYGGLLDEIITRIVDVLLALPFLLLALVVAVTIGQGLLIMIGLLTVAAWVGLVRNIRAQVLSLKNMDYVQLARVAGASDYRIMLRHIFPGTINIVVVLATLRVGGLILAESGLSYLGAGIPAHIPTWGLMISDGRDYLQTAWWVSVFPGIGIFLTVMSMNFLGDWMRDRFDPRLRQLR